MIELRSASLTALVSPFGATLAGLWTKLHPHSLVVGAPEQNAYRDHLAYSGALVGPVANRIADGKLTIAGEVCALERNDGRNTLHSGSDGLHAVEWDIARAREDTVSFSVSLAHGVGGLPGNRLIEATYTLTANALRLEITATSDAMTVMNIAHHPYWNLDGAATIAAHRLTVAAENYLPTNNELLPTGDIVSVQSTDYDFREMRPVSTTAPLDANLCLGQKRLLQPRKCATLSAPSGPVLEVHSTEPGLQVYNGFGLQDAPVALLDARKLVPCAGIALEPQNWPDAPNHSDFPSICLPAAEIYRQITEYRIF